MTKLAIPAPETKDADAQPPIQVGPEPELTAEERKEATKAIRDMLEANRKLNETDPSTRPSFTKPEAKAEIIPFPTNHPVLKRVEKGDNAGLLGFLPPVSDRKAPIQSEDDRLALLGEKSEDGTLYVNLFPKGDIDNFSPTRWSMAAQRAQYSLEGSAALRKHAPWESQYYYALDRYGEKAGGDMVSGQDGGYLAPVTWSNNFLDMLYSAQVLNDFPITRMNMGTRIEYMPRLTNAISIYYAAENAALTASQPQFSQLAFTARKQSALMQLSNELIRDSNPAADSIFQNHALRYMALDRDKQTLIGNGLAGAPQGLINVANFGGTTTLATASTPLFTEMNTGVYNVENLNGTSNVPIGQATCTGIFGAVALKSQILNMKDSNNRPIYDFGVNQMRGDFPATGGGQFDGLFGVPTIRYSNVLGQAAGSKDIIFGDWQHLIVMQRQDVEIMTSLVAGTAFQNDQTWIRIISRYDVGCAHPEAFFAYTNG